MNRQRVLERAGWVFWRCFASTWSLHKDEVLGELLERFTAMGIEPVGAIERAPTLVEKRVLNLAQPEIDKDNEIRIIQEVAVEAPKQNRQGELPLKRQETELADGQIDFQNEPKPHMPMANQAKVPHSETSQQPGGLSSRSPQQVLTPSLPEKPPGEYQPEEEQEWVVSKGSAALRKLHRWVKDSGDFQQSDVSHIYWVAQDVERKKMPSPANARKAKRLWEKAVRKGYKET
ncbi:MAG: hypothetical protein NTV04_17430 [Deltaproteobacteria bacterium]|nr:hypothetical protein [Deltaproteobacteria bacterium]